jgi:hypothetical protein
MCYSVAGMPSGIGEKEAMSKIPFICMAIMLGSVLYVAFDLYSVLGGIQTLRQMAY